MVSFDRLASTVIVASCLTATGQSGLDLYDCLESHQDQWTVMQKNWCCENRKRGCDIVLVNKPDKEGKPDMANATNVNLVRLQRQAELRTQSTTTQLLFDLPDNRMKFDCAHGYHSWRSTWDTQKRSWCCVYVGRGCEVQYGTNDVRTAVRTTVSPEFNCTSGLSRWATEWSTLKQKWCCENMRLGCTLATKATLHKSSTTLNTVPVQFAARAPVVTNSASAPFDCVVTGSNQLDDWAVAQKSWCCQHAKIGCGRSYAQSRVGQRTTRKPMTTTQNFDCMNDYQNWRWSWTDAKKDWCCKNKGLGCQNNGVKASARAGVYHDCKASLTNKRSSWGDDKREWCCKNQGVGCGAQRPLADTGGHVIDVQNAAENVKFDCMMDLGDFKRKWPEDKKVWCCEKQNIGCSVKYHKGHRVWFSRRFELDGSNSQRLSSISSPVQVLAAAAAACMLAVGVVLAFRRRDASRHPSYTNFLAAGSEVEENTSASA